MKYFRGQKTRVTIQVALVFCIGVSWLRIAEAEAPFQSIVLKNGRTVYAYPILQVPETLRRHECDRYVFATEGQEPLENGLYHVRTGEKFLAEENCLLPSTGESELSDGRKLSFFQEDTFNTNGHRVYFCQEHVCQSAPDAEYRLKNGQTFKVVDARIENNGFFDGKTIQYEDRE